jgi:hypothetical protein
MHYDYDYDYELSIPIRTCTRDLIIIIKHNALSISIIFIKRNSNFLSELFQN